MTTLESKFQAKLIKELYGLFRGCIVLKNDPNYTQGVPDLIILYKDRWAALEVKKEYSSHRQVNQEWFIKTMNKMSYASFISPETKEEVLDELQRSLKSGRRARLSGG